MKEKLNNIPLWFINITSVVSGVITIITSVINFIALYKNRTSFIWLFIIAVISFFILLICQIRKYKNYILMV